MEQRELWQVLFATIRPKSNESPSDCLNRLAREYFGESHRPLSEATAHLCQKECWLEELRGLERHHTRMRNFDDARPLVLLQRLGRTVVIDGNHRVTRALRCSDDKPHTAIFIQDRR